MSGAVSAIDVSDHQPADLSALIGHYDPQRVIIRLYLPVESARVPRQDWTLQAAGSVRSNGRSTGGYLWGYRSEDAAGSIYDALDIADRANIPLTHLKVDAETYLPGTSRYDPGPDSAWFAAAKAEIDRARLGAVAYTGLWWIEQVFPGGMAAFQRDVLDAGWRLWLADWDGIPDPAVFRWPAGFPRPLLAAKQYAVDEGPFGELDLDVVDAAVAGPSPNPDADVDEQDQFDPVNYDTVLEFREIGAAACSAASLAAVLNHYGRPVNISDALRLIRAEGDDVTPALGLLNLMGQGVGIERALDTAGIPSSVHSWDSLTRTVVREAINDGRPMIAQLHNYLGRGLGHFLVVDGLLPNDAGVTVADSNAGTGKRYSYAWPAFWAEMGGGVGILPDATPPADDPDDGEEDVARIKELEAEVADLEVKIEALTVALATVCDDVATDQGVSNAAAVAKEAQRIRAQFIGPRPPRASP